MSWVTALGPKYGQANVVIDGVNQGTVDLYSPTQQWQVAYGYDGLTAGTHTIEVKPLGTKNASSGGMDVVVDGFNLSAQGNATPTFTPTPTSTLPVPSSTPTLAPTGTGTFAPSVTATANGTTPSLFSAVPLMDMAQQTYLGFTGGLYYNGTNTIPPDHDLVGQSKAAQVQPLDTTGSPNANGKIVLLSIGMSNTAMEFCGLQCKVPNQSYDANAFMGLAANSSAVNHSTLVIINGAQGGQDGPHWTTASATTYDTIRDDGLTPRGLTENQVQVIWLKLADGSVTGSLPSPSADAYTLYANLGNAIRAIKSRYPNVQMVFVSSRTFGGYGTSNTSEPYSYEGGFAFQWIVQAQIDQMRNGGVVVDARAGDLNYNTVAPWIAWGPYLWTDGTTPRSDGLTWQPSDVQSDGIHPSSSGVGKVGNLLFTFFSSSPYTACWFLAMGCPATPTPTPIPATVTPTNTPSLTSTATNTPPGLTSGSVAYVGCSNTENSVQGYYTISGNNGVLWQPYYSGGATVEQWADPASSYWSTFDDADRHYPQTKAVWVQLCENLTKVQDTYSEVHQLFANLKQHAPNAAYYVSAINIYNPYAGLCPFMGTDGQGETDTEAWRDQAVADGLALRGPDMGLLTGATTLSDGCHPNTAGEPLLGQELFNFFDAGNQATWTPGPSPTVPPTVAVTNTPTGTPSPTYTNTATSTVTGTLSPTATPPTLHPVGYVGCSNSMMSVVGYDTIPGNHDLFWPQLTYDPSGGTVDLWADNTSPYWGYFDFNVRRWGAPNVVWVQLCQIYNQTPSLDYGSVQQVVRQPKAACTECYLLYQRDQHL